MHRELLLRALEERHNDSIIGVTIEAMTRATTMAHARPHAQAGLALNQARSKSRKPEINDWIATQLQRNPDAKSPALWADAPDDITDQIEFGRFQKRVTAVRKAKMGR